MPRGRKPKHPRLDPVVTKTAQTAYSTRYRVDNFKRQNGPVSFFVTIYDPCMNMPMQIDYVKRSWQMPTHIQDLLRPQLERLINNVPV